jgi:hypothetical protein
VTLCQKCGTELIGTRRFCTACGTPAFDPRAPTSPIDRDDVNPLAATSSPTRPNDALVALGDMDAGYGGIPDPWAAANAPTGSWNRPVAHEGLGAASISPLARTQRDAGGAGRGSMPNPYSRTITALPPLPTDAYTVGAAVDVLWSNGQRYGGVVAQLASTHVCVSFPDGQVHWVERRFVTPRG